MAPEVNASGVIAFYDAFRDARQERGGVSILLVDMAKIADIEGIGPKYAAALKDHGIDTTDELLAAGASKKGRADLAEKTGLSEKLVLEWVNRADLMRIKGIGSQYSDLLEHAGVDSVPELAQRNGANLAAKMAEINEAKNLTNRAPSEKEVEDWVEQAKGLDRVVTH